MKYNVGRDFEIWSWIGLIVMFVVVFGLVSTFNMLPTFQLRRPLLYLRRSSYIWNNPVVSLQSIGFGSVRSSGVDAT